MCQEQFKFNRPTPGSARPRAPAMCHWQRCAQPEDTRQDKHTLAPSLSSADLRRGEHVRPTEIGVQMLTPVLFIAAQDGNQLQPSSTGMVNRRWGPHPKEHDLAGPSRPMAYLTWGTAQ